MKKSKKDAEQFVGNALKKQEEDKLALEGMTEKMVPVDEFDAKLVANKGEVATLRVELL